MNWEQSGECGACGKWSVITAPIYWAPILSQDQATFFTHTIVTIKATISPINKWENQGSEVEVELYEIAIFIINSWWILAISCGSK